ncbi:MAG TPA: NlpC/P60 family protein, partial [Kineosporiaceae bacterium]|nr:NlpC/P60 family protein [Kineosporiaceae bacterium]
PKVTVEGVRQRVEQLHQQAEVATERYNGAKEQIASLTVRLAAARVKVSDQQKVLNAARAELGRIAADTYKAGDLATLSLFLGDDPDKTVAADGLLISLGDRKADAVRDLLRQRQALAGHMTDVQEQQQRLQKTEQDLQTARLDVQKKLAQASDELGRLTGDQRGQLTAGNNFRDRSSLSDLGITVPRSGRAGCDDVPVVTTDPRVAKVLGYACAQLGDPYAWAGNGPRNFDCSGLTLMAWRQAGVSLPHNAAMQAGYGKRVGKGQLRPGDLVFFRSPIGHVGIYVGDGAMLHAPQTGDVVKIAPMRWNDFAGAVRL